MKRHVLSARAERDLNEIIAYLIDQAGPDVALDVLHQLRRAIRIIASRPYAGHRREDITLGPVRFWLVRSYLIVYDPTRKPVEIVRIVHGARDLQHLL
jgi:antitoxin ParD1/3/4/toxin ParE1/3/4